MWETLRYLIQVESLKIIIICIVSYLIGGLNFSIMISRSIGNKKDIREMGSGNAGFTNTLRTVGAKPAVLTFIGDFLKGVIAVFLGRYIMSLAYIPSGMYGGDGQELALQIASYIAGFMCLLGHIYPCFYGFKGGKGILTTWATILLIDWRIFLIVITVFLIVLAFSKIVSLASLAAAVSYPITTLFITYFWGIHSKNIDYCIFCVLVCLVQAGIVVYKHKSNILRLLSGQEKKIKAKKL